MKSFWTGACAFLLVVGIVIVGNALTLTDIPNEGSISKIKEVVNANNTLIEADSTTLTGYFTAQTDTNTLADSTDWTPRFVGDTLIGTVSNLVYVSKGTTTNDWIQVSN